MGRQARLWYWIHKQTESMRKTKDLIWLVGGVLLFLVGALNAWHPVFIKYIFMGLGVVSVSVFYFDIFIHVIHMSQEAPLRIFWLIAIICMPIVGCMIYVIYYEMAGRIQKPADPGVF